MNSKISAVEAQKKAINQWADALVVFLGEQRVRLTKNGIDELYQEFLACFMKNSSAMFSLVLQTGMSYQIAQTIRFLVELTADMNFIVKHPENVNHIKTEINRLLEKCEQESDGARWREFIANSGEIGLMIDGKLARKAGCGTEKRVEGVFGKNFYDFYSSYSHANVFVFRDDVSRFMSGDDFIFVQRWELIKDYPLILEKFIHTIGEAAGDEDLAKFDCSSFTNSFSDLLQAIMVAHYMG